MTPRLPAPVLRAGLTAFRRLPAWARRRAVHAGTPGYTLGALLVLQNAAGEFLLVRPRHLAGWTLPGGLLQSGESPAAALAREIREEVGLTIDLGDELPRALVHPEARRVDLIFVGSPSSTAGEDQQVTVDGVEVLEAGWFRGTDLPPHAETTADVLRRIGAVAPQATPPPPAPR
jgi:ADP-ribose pyrophosphatase YjhB (NUDIX family)